MHITTVTHGKVKDVSIDENGSFISFECGAIHRTAYKEAVVGQILGFDSYGSVWVKES